MYKRQEEYKLPKGTIVEIERGNKFITLCKAAHITVNFLTKRYFIKGFNSYAKINGEEPVSYTHLATATSMAGSLVGAGIGNKIAGNKGALIGGFVGGMVNPNIRFGKSSSTNPLFNKDLVYGSKINNKMAKSVSYTHLDVYKRQV